MSQNSSGGGLKILLGCGCLLGIIVAIAAAVIVAIGAGGFFAMNEAKEKAEELAVEAERMQEMTEKFKEEQAKKAEAAADQGSVSRRKFLSWPTKPLSVDEALEHQKFMAEWKNSKAVDLLESGKSLGEFSNKEDSSALEKLEALESVKNLAFGAGPARDELDQMSKTYGGADKVFERYYKLLAVCAAADGVAREKKIKDLSSDKVAAAMIDLHPESEKQFKDWETLYLEQYKRAHLVAKDPEAAKKAAQDKQAQEDMKRLGEASTALAQKPGVFLLGKLPASSVLAWKALDQKQRAAIAKSFKETPFLPAFTMGSGKVDFETAARQLIAIQTAQIFIDAQEQSGAKP